MPDKKETTRKSSHPFLWLLLGMLIISCLIVIVGFSLVSNLSKRAERIFGPASENLSPVQRLQYSQRLLSQRKALDQIFTQPGKQASFSVEPGESIASITRRLQDDGWIQDAGALRDYLVYSGLDTSIQSGEFELDSSMTAIQIAQTLQDATPDQVTFRVLAGWRIEEIAGAIPTSGLEFSPEGFTAAAMDPDEVLVISGYLPEGASLEGFLFPDRYRLPRETDISTFLEAITTNFEIKVDHQMRVNYNNIGLSIFQAVTLASIVQREAVVEEEMPMIASVFLNRLNTGMKLETDPTVQYALGFDRISKSWWKNPLSLDDLQVNSPYNTYLYHGLPPGPIANPGLSALNAVAYPAQTPYYYFRSACDGSGRHNFAETFDQHQRNACPKGAN